MKMRLIDCLACACQNRLKWTYDSEYKVFIEHLLIDSFRESIETIEMRMPLCEAEGTGKAAVTAKYYPVNDQSDMPEY